VAGCLEAAGQAPEPILAAATGEGAKERLRARTDEAVRRGVFGAPTFLSGDELFWGNDRLADALRWHRAHAGA
jgi:2-hydroxychromene-2-carboxylate isomerase